MVILLDTLKSRRSIRKFQDKEIEREKIDTIFRGVLRSPSSRGRRPWEFVAVTDKEILQKLSLCRQNSSQFLSGAPLGIVIIADTEVGDVWVEDASIVAITAQLMAQSQGLGSCWIQVRGRDHTETETAGDYIKKVLGIPEKYEVQCIIAIGYPAEERKPYSDEELPYQKIHYNKY
jgi:nitroreductase